MQLTKIGRYHTYSLHPFHLFSFPPPQLSSFGIQVFSGFKSVALGPGDLCDATVNKQHHDERDQDEKRDVEDKMDSVKE